MYADPQLTAVAHELAGRIQHQALFDSVQNLLVAGLEADQQQAQAVIAQLPQRFVIEVCARVAGPRELQLLHALRDLDGTGFVDGERVVVEHPLAHAVAEKLLAHFHLADHGGGRFSAVNVAADGLRPEAEAAFGRAAAPRIERNIGVLQVADEVVLDLQIAVINREDAGHSVPVVNELALGVVVNAAIGVAPAEAFDPGPRFALRQRPGQV